MRFKTETTYGTDVPRRSTPIHAVPAVAIVADRQYEMTMLLSPEATESIRGREVEFFERLTANADDILKSW